MIGFEFKVKPFAHQLKIFKERKNLEGDCLFMEQGTAKTKCAIDQIAYHYLNHSIDAALVLAPNGVQLNWITDQLPAHMPDAVMGHTATFCWESSRAGTKKHQRAAESVLHHGGLSFAVMSYDGFMTTRGQEFAKKFLTKRKVFYVLDESSEIQTPGIKRTKTVLSTGKHGVYRRVLEGTPVTSGPFGVYTQVKFAHPTFWKEQGLGDFYAFKTFFGVFEKGYNGATGREFDKLVGYKNLDVLHKLLDKISFRVLKQDVFDLPPKLYSVRYFEPTSEQNRINAELKLDYLAYLADGREVAAPLAITRLLRFQQVLCGYAPTSVVDDDGYVMFDTELVDLPGGNPRLALLKEVCEHTPHKAIIWARFTRDIDKIMELLGDKAVRYDGKVKSQEDREMAKVAFQDGDAQFFVSNPAAGGRGLTLHSAQTVIYYNNSFKLRERLQSEDRAHRAGLEHPVQYIDLVAPDTVDVHILQQLRNNIDIASTITGDGLKEWVL